MANRIVRFSADGSLPSSGSETVGFDPQKSSCEFRSRTYEKESAVADAKNAAVAADDSESSHLGRSSSADSLVSMAPGDSLVDTEEECDDDVDGGVNADAAVAASAAAEAAASHAATREEQTEPKSTCAAAPRGSEVLNSREDVGNCGLFFELGQKKREGGGRGPKPAAEALSCADHLPM